MEFEAIYKKYIANHRQNKTLPKTIKLLIDQHKEDLRQKGWDYYWDPTTPDRYCRMISKLQIVNDRKQAFQLQNFQVFIVFLLFGWRKTDDGTRRYTEVLYSVARKNGKSELFAGIVWALSWLENIENNTVYAIANSKDQIKESIYAAMGEMVKNTFPDFVKKKQIIVNQAEIRMSKTTITPLATNTANLDGLKLNVGVIDEMHESYDPNKLQVLRSGMAARSSPLLAITTTAGFDKKSDYYRYYLEATNSLYGKSREFQKLYIIYELDKDDDIYDTSKWIKANPGLFTIKKPDIMHSLARRAPYVPTEKTELVVKHLNRFLSSGANKYLDVDILKAAMVPASAPESKRSAMGLDLSINDDLSVYAIEIEAPKPYLLLRCFVAEKYLDEKIKENTLFAAWLDSGLLIRAGECIDEDIIFDWIERDIITYNVKALGYDRYKMGAMIARIESRFPDLLTKSINQKSGMSEPLKSFAGAVANKKIQVEQNPILEWMADNAIMFDNSGILRIVKIPGPQHKIDGIVASVMAHYMLQLMILQPESQRPTINYDL